jgi:hypothetical protein
MSPEAFDQQQENTQERREVTVLDRAKELVEKSAEYDTKLSETGSVIGQILEQARKNGEGEMIAARLAQKVEDMVDIDVVSEKTLPGNAQGILDAAALRFKDEANKAIQAALNNETSPAAPRNAFLTGLENGMQLAA